MRKSGRHVQILHSWAGWAQRQKHRQQWEGRKGWQRPPDEPDSRWCVQKGMRTICPCCNWPQSRSVICYCHNPGGSHKGEGGGTKRNTTKLLQLNAQATWIYTRLATDKSFKKTRLKAFSLTTNFSLMIKSCSSWQAKMCLLAYAS